MTATVSSPKFPVGCEQHTRFVRNFAPAHRSGEYLWVQGRGKAVYDDDGQDLITLPALSPTLRDRKKLEAELAQRDEQLRQSHKLEAVGSLAGGIAHEFNNLLQAIRGYTQYAMEGLQADDHRHQDLEQVVKASDRAAALTRELLGFSRRQVLRARQRRSRRARHRPGEDAPAADRRAY